MHCWALSAISLIGKAGIVITFVDLGLFFYIIWWAVMNQKATRLFTVCCCGQYTMGAWYRCQGPVDEFSTGSADKQKKKRGGGRSSLQSMVGCMQDADRQLTNPKTETSHQTYSLFSTLYFNVFGLSKILGVCIPENFPGVPGTQGPDRCSSHARWLFFWSLKINRLMNYYPILIKRTFL